MNLRIRITVWLTCLALLLGGAMAGWGQLARTSGTGMVDLLADWCASPVGQARDADAQGDPTGDHALHAKVHCDLCVVAADLPSPPALHVPVLVPAASAGWRPASDVSDRGRLPWQRPQPRGPPRRA